MRYAIVATTGHLLLVDLESRAVTPLEFKRPEYYGVSWFAEGEDLVLSHSGLDNAELIDIASYARSEVGWISIGERRSRPFLSMPHQILCAPDGRVVVTNTGRNAVEAFDPGNPSVRAEVRLGEARWDRLSRDDMPGDHLNSVFLGNGKLYVIAHRFTRGSRIGVFDYPSLDLTAMEDLGNRTGLHNIWVTEEGQRISCHSETGGLVDLDDPVPLWRSGASVYTRGLAATRDHVVVGESAKTGRDQRRHSCGGLWILDRESWRAVDYLCLGPYGAVNEVRLLDVPDLAHTGVAFRGLRKLVTDTGVFAWMTGERLAGADLANRARSTWRRFELVLGSPETLPDGAQRAADELVLALLRDSPGQEASLEFEYRLDPGAESSHVSGVIGYEGGGGDQDMTAFLLQPVDASNASLSVWVHDRTAWRRHPDVPERLGLPLSGRYEIRRASGRIAVAIDGTAVMQVDGAGLPAGRPDGRVGIRWMGSAVRPTS